MAAEDILPFKFEKGKTGNPNGRPTIKLTSSVNKALEKVGVEKATNTEIDEVFRRLLNLPKSRLRELVNDKEMPILISITAEMILDNPEHIERVIDRVAGKARQSIVTEDGEGNTMPMTITLISQPLKPDNAE